MSHPEKTKIFAFWLRGSVFVFYKKPGEGKGKASLKAKTPGFAPENTACLAKALRRAACFILPAGKYFLPKPATPARKTAGPPHALGPKAQSKPSQIPAQKGRMHNPAH